MAKIRIHTDDNTFDQEVANMAQTVEQYATKGFWCSRTIYVPAYRILYIEVLEGE